MKLFEKITLTTLATIIAMLAGIFTVIEKTPRVIEVVGSMVKAEASETPDTVTVTTKREKAGEVNETEIKTTPTKAK